MANGGASDSADNYTTMNFDGFAVSWNRHVDRCVTDGVKEAFTYKNTSLLKDAYTRMKRGFNRSVAMLDMGCNDRED